MGKKGGEGGPAKICFRLLSFRALDRLSGGGGVSNCIIARNERNSPKYASTAAAKYLRAQVGVLSATPSQPSGSATQTRSMLIPPSEVHGIVEKSAPNPVTKWKIRPVANSRHPFWTPEPAGRIRGKVAMCAARRQIQYLRSVG